MDNDKTNAESQEQTDAPTLPVYLILDTSEYMHEIIGRMNSAIDRVMAYFCNNEGLAPRVRLTLIDFNDEAFNGLNWGDMTRRWPQGRVRAFGKKSYRAAVWKLNEEMNRHTHFTTHHDVSVLEPLAFLVTSDALDDGGDWADALAYLKARETWRPLVDVFVFDEAKETDVVGVVAAQLPWYRNNGLLVSLEQVGDPRLVSTLIARHVRRVVGVGLRNTQEHGGPGVQAIVRMRWLEDALEVEVLDDGTPQPVPEWRYWPGKSLDGLGERLGEVGGTMESGRRPEGGFRLHVSLPTNQSKLVAGQARDAMIAQLCQLATSGSVRVFGDADVLAEALYAAVTSSVVASVTANQAILVPPDLAQR